MFKFLYSALFLIPCFLLPVFGNRPGSSHVLFLTITFICLILGSTFLDFFSNQKKINSSKSESVSIVSLYVLISVLSLGVFYSSDLLEIFYYIFNSGNSLKEKFEHLSRFIFYIFVQEENSVYYPLASVLHTLLAFLVYKKVCTSISKKIITAKSYLLVFTMGLITTLFFGFYNYYYPGIINSIRPIDPIVNPGGVEFRLQSFFGHSGWFAEYVTLVVPSVLVLLLLRISFKLRAILIVIILSISEFALILSYQRGAWLSYPITLFVIWSAIYCFYIFEKNNSGAELKFTFLSVLKKSFFKILVSIPITIIFSLSIVWIISKFEIIEGRTFHGLWSYSDRFKQIANTNDRTQFFKAGFKIGSLHPILGAGSESFSIQYEKEFTNESGNFYKQIDLPLHGSSHNVFMQTFSGKGFLGLLSLILILYSCLLAGYRGINDPKISKEKLIICLFSFCFSCSFIIYGQVQEVFYVQSLQYLFFIFLAVIKTSAPEYSKLNLIENNKSKIYLSILVLFILHSVLEYQNSDLNSLSGCYSKEIDSSSGHPFYWCGPRAEIKNPGSQLIIEVPVSNKDQVNFYLKGYDKNNIEIFSDNFLVKAGENKKLENLNISNLVIKTNSVIYAKGDRRALSFIVK